MQIRTGPDFQIQYILNGKWQNPDCAVRIAVKKALFVAIVIVRILLFTVANFLEHVKTVVIADARIWTRRLR